MKNNLPYFSHYSTTHDEPIMQAFLSEYGFEGYGRFWILCEKIAASPNAALDISGRIVKMAIARTLGLGTDDFDSFIRFLSAPDIKLIRLENGLITNDQVQEDYVNVTKKRIKDRENYHLNNNPTSKTPVPTSEIIQNRVEYSTLDQSSSSGGGKNPPPQTTTTTIQKFLEVSKKAGFVIDSRVAANILAVGFPPDWIEGDFNLPKHLADRIKNDPKYKDKPPQELKRLYIKSFTWPDIQEDFPEWRELKKAEAIVHEENREMESLNLREAYENMLRDRHGNTSEIPSDDNIEF
jgi:hypothetical protein